MAQETDTNKRKRKGPKFRDEVRQALADYIASEGCGCCRDENAHSVACDKLAKLLDVPMFKNGSGYNFWLFRTRRERGQTDGR